MGSVRRGLAAVAAAGALAGCGSEGKSADGDAGKASATAAAVTGITVGAKGSACELPVTFQVTKSWKPEAVDSSSTGDPALDAILRQGPVTGVCEIDGKPSGHIGFLRVWQGKPGGADARATLQAFVAADTGVGEQTYRTFRAGDVTGVEVEYRVTSKLLDETKTEHALAVPTPEGPVVLHLGGWDDGEHKALLPGYELAKRTLRVTA